MGENMEQIYTRKQLIELGYNDYKIKKGIIEGQIRKVDRGKFIIIHQQDELIQKHQGELEKITMETIYDLLEKNELEKVATCLEKIDSNTLPIKEKRIYNLYLFLSNKCLSLSGSLQNEAQKMDIYDFSDKKTAYNDPLRLFLWDIWLGKTHVALQILNCCDLPKEYLLCNKFLAKIKEKELQQYHIVEEQLKNRDWQSLQTTLTSSNLALSKIIQNQLLLITRDAIPLIETGEVLSLEQPKSNHLTDLITAHQYKKIYPQIENKSNSLNKKLLKLAVTKILEENETLLKKKDSVPETRVITFNDVFNALMNDEDLEKMVTTYLEQKQQSKYLPVLKQMLAISNSKQDVTYRDFLLTLSEIEQGTYQFILARYLKDFYRCLEKENYSVAKQYLYLMNLSKQYETTSADLTNFEGYLLALEKLQQNQTKIDILSFHNTATLDGDNTTNSDNIPATSPDDSLAKENKEEPSLADDATMESREVLDETPVSFIEEQEPSYKLLSPIKQQKLKRNIEKLIHFHSVYSLYIEDDEYYQELQQFLKENYPNVAIHMLRRGKLPNYGMLKRKEKTITNSDELRELAGQYYDEKKYQKALEQYLIFFENTDDIRNNVLYRIAICYMKTNHLIEARPFLEALSHTNTFYCDFPSVQNWYLVGADYRLPKSDETEVKRAEIDWNELKVDQSCYSIPNLQRIANDYALGEMSLDDICTEYGLEKDDISVVKYIFARDCYYQRQDELGNHFLSLLRKEKNKSEEATYLLETLENEKRFLPNHEFDPSRCLTLKFPKKH